MTLAERYNPAEMEPEIEASWQEWGVYHFDRDDLSRPVFSIDTPPPTVSGSLHLGHVYSYSHADFIARYQRMRGRNVFYPMGFDDNGLPTERLVEKRLGLSVADLGREEFIRRCLELSAAAVEEYRAVWRRLGLSVDWRYTYRTIDAPARRIAQLSFMKLYQKGRVERRSAPTIWCPECRTAVAQAELEDLERDTEFVTLPFALAAGGEVRISTTRPELLAACVAIFIHPDDQRFAGMVGQKARVPLYGQVVPVLADRGADPHKGTGAVMCCTFGDQADMAWWRQHNLPLIEAVDRSGRMTEVCGPLAGMPVSQARKEIKNRLAEAGLVLDRVSTRQSVRVHERCDTPVEIVVSSQWFIRLLDMKDRLLEVGRQVRWHPESMGERYRAWVEGLSWDWAISRQRAFGVPFPVWTCRACGAAVLAKENQLPVDPLVSGPGQACACGGEDFIPDPDVMDTWATSSMSPEIVGGWLEDPALYERVSPFTLRPQAHEIIRTWAFYTLVKSELHFGRLPWSDVLISGWGLAGEGMGKISKSKGGGPMSPMESMRRTSADALRYWAAGTSPGKDTLISEDKFQMGQRLATKLWNVARFAERFLTGGSGGEPPVVSFTSADRWILADLQVLVREVTSAFDAFEYAQARSLIENFFWSGLADNYLEMAKQRLYAGQGAGNAAARYVLGQVLLTTLKLLAPLMPFVTEAVYRELFSDAEGEKSIHRAGWPTPQASLEDEGAVRHGRTLVTVLSAVRRFKTENKLGLGSAIKRVQLATLDPGLAAFLREAGPDLVSATRAEILDVVSQRDATLTALVTDDDPAVALQL